MYHRSWRCRAARSFFAIVVVLVAVPSPCDAASDGGVGSAAAGWSVLDDPRYTSLVEPWELLLAEVHNGNLKHAGHHAETLVDKARDLGLDNLPSLTRALAVVLSQPMPGEDDALVVELAEALIDMAPDLPESHLAVARAIMDAEGGGFFSGVGQLMAGLRAAAEDPPTVLLAGASFLAYFYLFVSVYFLVFVIGLVVKHWTLFLHHLSHLLGRRVFVATIGVVVLLLLLLLLHLGVGLLVPLMVVPLVLHRFLERYEKVLFVVFLVLLAGLPLTGRVLGLATELYGGPWGSVLECSRGPCGGEDFDELSTLAGMDKEDHAGNPLAMLVLGNVYLSSTPVMPTHWVEAEALFTRVIEAAPYDFPEVYVSFGTLQLIDAFDGCAIATAGSVDSAIDKEAMTNALALWDEALALDPSLYQASYDKHFVLSRLGKTDEAAAQLDEATMLDSEAVLSFTSEMLGDTVVPVCPTDFNVNRLVMGADVGPWRIAWEALRTMDGPDQLVFLQPVLLGSLAPSLFSLLTAMAIILFLVAVIFLRGEGAPSLCSRCGAVRCTKCNEELGGVALCTRCLLFEIKGSYSDPTEKWFEERRVERRRSLRRWLIRGLGLVLPGLADLMTGKPFRGLFLPFVMFGFVLLGIVPEGIVPLPPHLVMGGSLAMTIGSWGVAFFFWVLGIVLTLRREPR